MPSGYPKFKNDLGVREIRIGSRQFACVGASPPNDHPHVYLDMGASDQISCPYCATLFQYDPAVAPFAAGVAETLDVEADAIEERAAIISETCPAPYADTFARLSHQKPFAVSREEWQCAVNNTGLFLDAWGPLAVELLWTAADLFDVPRDGRPGGLVWRLKGERVETLGKDDPNDHNQNRNHNRGDRMIDEEF